MQDIFWSNNFSCVAITIAVIHHYCKLYRMQAEITSSYLCKKRTFGFHFLNDIRWKAQKRSFVRLVTSKNIAGELLLREYDTTMGNGIQIRVMHRPETRRREKGRSLPLTELGFENTIETRLRWEKREGRGRLAGGFSPCRRENVAFNRIPLRFKGESRNKLRYHPPWNAIGSR